MNFDEFFVSFSESPNPLKPTGAVRQLFQSYFSLWTATKSCGLLGPATEGTTVDKSNSSTQVYLRSASFS